MLTAGQSYPALWEKAGDLMVRNMGWPGASKLADRLEKTLPPGLLESNEDGAQPMVQTPEGPVPVEQAGQMIAQMGEALKNASEAVDKAGVLEKEAKMAEVRIKEEEAKTKQYDAETKRMSVEADILRAQTEAGQANGAVQALIQAQVTQTLSELLDTPVEQLGPLADHPELQGMQPPPGPEGMPPEPPMEQMQAPPPQELPPEQQPPLQ
jgi:hypothetical protein